jgi:hypothetical protein
LSTHVCLGLPSALSSWLSHKYSIFIPLLSHSCYMPRPFHPPWLDHSIYTWKRVQVMKLLITQFFQPPVTSSLFCPNILLNTPL